MNVHLRRLSIAQRQKRAVNGFLAVALECLGARQYTVRHGTHMCLRRGFEADSEPADLGSWRGAEFDYKTGFFIKARHQVKSIDLSTEPDVLDKTQSKHPTPVPASP